MGNAECDDHRAMLFVKQVLGLALVAFRAGLLAVVDGTTPLASKVRRALVGNPIRMDTVGRQNEERVNPPVEVRLRCSVQHELRFACVLLPEATAEFLVARSLELFQLMLEGLRLEFEFRHEKTRAV